MSLLLDIFYSTDIYSPFKTTISFLCELFADLYKVFNLCSQKGWKSFHDLTS